MKINELLQTNNIIKDHEIVFRSLVGSHNYNINTSDSDEDYKVFVYPTFSDIYHNKQINSNVVTDTVDYTIADIRKLPMLLFKANISFIEVLFSKQIVYNKTDYLTNYLINNRDKYAGMNIKGLYNSCYGMHIEKMKRLHKYNFNNFYMEEEYGYNVKEACHAIRLILTCILFQQSGFQDFNGSFSFNDNTEYRNLLIDIKNGIYREEEFLKIEEKYMNDFKILEQYFNVKPNNNIYQELDRQVEYSIQQRIKRENCIL